MSETKKIKIRKNNQINIKQFCETNGILYRYINVWIGKDGKKHTKSDHNNYSVKEIMEKPTVDSPGVTKITHISLYIKYTKSLYIVDIDDEENKHESSNLL